MQDASPSQARSRERPGSARSERSGARFQQSLDGLRRRRNMSFCAGTSASTVSGVPARGQESIGSKDAVDQDQEKEQSDYELVYRCIAELEQRL